MKQAYANEPRPRRNKHHRLLESVRARVHDGGFSIMNSKPHASTGTSVITRRTFLRNGAVLTTGIASLGMSARAQTNKK
jgi:hypothetical protein